MMESARRAAETEQNDMVRPHRKRLANALAAYNDADNDEDHRADFKDIKLKVSLIRYREGCLEWLAKARAGEPENVAPLLPYKRGKVGYRYDTLLSRALGEGSLDPSLTPKARERCLRLYYATKLTSHALEYLKPTLA